MPPMAAIEALGALGRSAGDCRYCFDAQTSGSARRVRYGPAFNNRRLGAGTAVPGSHIREREVKNAQVGVDSTAVRFVSPIAIGSLLRLLRARRVPCGVRERRLLSKEQQTDPSQVNPHAPEHHITPMHYHHGFRYGVTAPAIIS